MKTIAIILAAVALSSCAGVTSFTISTPYGDASKDALGNVSISPRAIIIPAK
jgi:hypothetical protein